MDVFASVRKSDSQSQADNRQHFEKLMRESYRQVFSLAIRLTGNASEAEDLVQESYVRAFRFFHRYDRSLQFTSWLYRIMTNVHIDSIRRKSRLKVTSLDSVGPQGNKAWDVPDQSSTPEETMVESHLAEPFQIALRAMTPEFRMAVMLADVEGLAYEEIAEMMDISVGTVRSRIHRGRKQLKERLGPNFLKEISLR
ncbi:MAG: sigma-70 family RNA polymerase sigma factor [Chthonomonas sp.]|nr:sigma-70 family RNA polymerase sigma factor [Chthonomonas sp.]